MGNLPPSGRTNNESIKFPRAHPPTTAPPQRRLRHDRLPMVAVRLPLHEVCGERQSPLHPTLARKSGRKRCGCPCPVRTFVSLAGPSPIHSDIPPTEIPRGSSFLFARPTAIQRAGGIEVHEKSPQRLTSSRNAKVEGKKDAWQADCATGIRPLRCRAVGHVGVSRRGGCSAARLCQLRPGIRYGGAEFRGSCGSQLAADGQ